MNKVFPEREAVINLANEDIRGVCSSMHKKYHAEAEHSSYLIFVDEANQFVDYFQSLQK